MLRPDGDCERIRCTNLYDCGSLDIIPFRFYYFSKHNIICIPDTVTTLASGLDGAESIAFTPSGSLVYVLTNFQLLTMSVGGTPLVLAGQTGSGFAEGQGTTAMFNYARELAVHPVSGIIYITDQGNHRIRACSPTGLVSTLAGTGVGVTNYSSHIYIDLFVKYSP